MIRRLTLTNSDDETAHYERLRHLRAGDEAVIRHRSRRTKFRVAPTTSNHFVRFEDIASGELHYLLGANASQWYLDGEPLFETKLGETLRFAAFYAALLGSEAQIVEKNLRTTDSSVVLAGRAMGKTATESALAACRLRLNGADATVSELLAIHAWQPQAASRVRYFNPRPASGDRFDRQGPPPKLVVADGPRAFEAVRSEPSCSSASIIALVSRCGDPAQLETLAETALGLSQWYEVDDLGDSLPEAPASVATVVLRVRSK